MKKFTFTILLLASVLTTNVYAGPIGQELNKHVVKIQDSANDDICTGVVLSVGENKTIILTARHCMQNGLQVETYPVTFRAIDSNNDAAILFIDVKLENKVPVKWPKRNVVKGDIIYTFGYPSGKPEFHIGQVTSLVSNAFIMEDRHTFTIMRNMLEANLLVRPGNSGGPVFNQNYEFVGIAVAGNLSDHCTKIVGLTELLSFLTAFFELGM